MAIATVFLLAALQSTQPVQAASGASIDGTAARADSGAPLPGARVTLTRFRAISNEFSGAERVSVLETDGQGRFVFRNLVPGIYVLTASSNGFIQVPPYAPADRAVTVAAGEVKSGVVIWMTPAGTVSGRITDRVGRPLAKMPVDLFRRSNGDAGAAGYESIASVATDDRGEYRVDAVPGDDYFLVVGMPGGTPDDAHLGAASQGFESAVYPGGIEFNASSRIAVAADATVRLKDLALGPVQFHRIRGRVADAATGQPPPRAFVWITPAASPIGADTIMESPRYDAATGAFETRVGPGRYRLGVTIPTAPRMMAAPGTVLPAPPPQAAEVIVTISDRDVDGVTLTLSARDR
jgi:hypothetical protein